MPERRKQRDQSTQDEYGRRREEQCAAQEIAEQRCIRNVGIALAHAAHPTRAKLVYRRDEAWSAFAQHMRDDAIAEPAKKEAHERHGIRSRQIEEFHARALY